MLTAIERSPKIFVCAMKGISQGGGVEMAAACDIRVAAEDARFALPEVKIGIMPDYGGTQRVARLMGKGRALRFILSAEPMDAVTAQGVGLVDVLSDTGAAEATALTMAESAALSTDTVEGVMAFVQKRKASVCRVVRRGRYFDADSRIAPFPGMFTDHSVPILVRHVAPPNHLRMKRAEKGESVKLASFCSTVTHGRIMEKLSSLAQVVRCGSAWGRKVHVRSNATAGRP